MSTPEPASVEARDSRPVLGGSIVCVYDSHADAENAIRALQKGGADMRALSIVGKDYQTEEDVVGFYTAGDRMLAWGKRGAFWGGMWGLLCGSAFFVVPGVGPLLAAGPLVGWIVGALENAAIFGGLSAIGAGLVSIGIPKDSIIQYETHIKAGKYVVVAHGEAAETAVLRTMLDATQHRGLTAHVCA